LALKTNDRSRVFKPCIDVAPVAQWFVPGLTTTAESGHFTFVLLLPYSLQACNAAKN